MAGRRWIPGSRPGMTENGTSRCRGRSLVFRPNLRYGNHDDKTKSQKHDPDTDTDPDGEKTGFKGYPDAGRNVPAFGFFL